MKELIEVMTSLISDNEHILNVIDKNIDCVKNNDIDTLNKETNNFYSFLNNYKIKNDKFKELMKINGFSSIWDIEKNKEFDFENKRDFLKKFEQTIRDAQTKINLYSKLISSELNTINKIKYFKDKGNIDFKI